MNNKKKGFFEFYHLQRNYEPNYSPKFRKFFLENNNGFMRYKGEFTELYDSYIKNGNIYQLSGQILIILNYPQEENIK